MMCKCCNVRVNWTKKSVVQKHCDSAGHTANKAKSSAEPDKTKQSSVRESLSYAEKLKENRDEFVESTVRAFLSANIPLKKLEHKSIRNWMNKYVKGELHDLMVVLYKCQHYFFSFKCYFWVF